MSDTARGLGYGLESVGIQYGRRMRESADQLDRDIQASMTPGGQRANQEQIFTGERLSDLRVSPGWKGAAVMQAARSAPQMAVMALPGGVVSAGISKALPILSKVGYLPAAAGAVAENAPGILAKAARWAPSAIGYGGAEGVQAGLTNAAQTQTQIEGMSHAELLAKSPEYNAILAQTDPSLPTEQRQDLARRQVAQRAANDVAMRTTISTGGIGALTGGGALGMLERGAEKSAVKKVLGSFATEAIQETPQSGAEQYIQQLALQQHADETADPTSQVVQQALGGGVVGGLTGAATGGAGAAMGFRRAPAAAQPEQPAAPLPQSGEPAAKIPLPSGDRFSQEPPVPTGILTKALAVAGIQPLPTGQPAQAAQDAKEQQDEARKQAELEAMQAGQAPGKQFEAAATAAARDDAIAQLINRPYQRQPGESREDQTDRLKKMGMYDALPGENRAARRARHESYGLFEGAQNAEAVRSDRGQAGQGGEGGQPGIQRGAVEGGGDLQQPAPGAANVGGAPGGGDAGITPAGHPAAEAEVKAARAPAGSPEHYAALRTKAHETEYTPGETKAPAELHDANLVLSLMSYSGANERWAKWAARGLSDAELKEVIGHEYGIMGGSASQAHKGGANPQFFFNVEGGMASTSGKPTLQGKKLIDNVRRVMGIPQPAEPAATPAEAAQPAAPATGTAEALAVPTAGPAAQQQAGIKKEGKAAAAMPGGAEKFTYTGPELSVPYEVPALGTMAAHTAQVSSRGAFSEFIKQHGYEEGLKSLDQSTADPAKKEAGRKLLEMMRPHIKPVGAQGASPVDAAAHEAATSHKNDLPQPTPAQIEAGNYHKGPVKVGGLTVSIENPQGSVRRSKPGAVPAWKRTMADHYGYIKGVPARAPDKEHVDVFVKPGTSPDHAGDVFVIDQNHANGKFDEPKAMLGYGNQAEAKAAYLHNYTKGWESRIRGITQMTMEQFKARLQDPKAFLTPQASHGTAVANMRALLEKMKAKAAAQGRVVDDRLLENIRNLEHALADKAAAEKTPTPGTALVPKQTLFVERGGKRFEVASLQEASDKWNQFRDVTGAGASKIGEGAKIVDQDGKEVARISYNGKVWGPGKWKPGDKPLVGENFKPSAPKEAEKAAEVAQNRIETTTFPAGTTLYHGTAGVMRALDNTSVVYLTDSVEDAASFASGAIPGTRRGANGEPSVKDFILSRDASVLDINAEVEEEIMGDGQLDELITAKANEVRSQGYDFLRFMHPSAVGDDFMVYVALNAKDTLQPIQKSEVKASDAARVSAEDSDALIAEIMAEKKAEAEGKKAAIVPTRAGIKVVPLDEKGEPVPGAAHMAGEKPAQTLRQGEFEKGARVEFTTGKYEGRHGEITEKNAMVMRPIFGGGATERLVSYQVHTDNGGSVHANPNEITAETAKPASVVADVNVGDHWTDPTHAYSMIGYYKTEANGKRLKSARAKRPDMRASHLKLAHQADVDAKRYQDAFDAWAQKYPAEAAAIRPKAEAVPVAPMSAPATAGLPSMTMEQVKHTKTGQDLWVVRLGERVDTTTFATLKGKARSNAGVWSNFTKGFNFTTPAGAEAFMGKPVSVVVQAPTEERPPKPFDDVKDGGKEVRGKPSAGWGEKPLGKIHYTEWRKTEPGNPGHWVTKISGGPTVRSSEIELIPAAKQTLMGGAPPGGWTEADKVPEKNRKPTGLEGLNNIALDKLAVEGVTEERELAARERERRRQGLSHAAAVGDTKELAPGWTARITNLASNTQRNIKDYGQGKRRAIVEILHDGKRSSVTDGDGGNDGIAAQKAFARAGDYVAARTETENQTKKPVIQQEPATTWPIEDLREVLEKANDADTIAVSGAGGIPLVPTIQEVGAMGKTEHKGYGMFETVGTDAQGKRWTMTWDAGGAMRTTSGGQKWTNVSLDGKTPYPSGVKRAIEAEIERQGKANRKPVTPQVPAIAGTAPLGMKKDQWQPVGTSMSMGAALNLLPAGTRVRDAGKHEGTIQEWKSGDGDRVRMKLDAGPTHIVDGRTLEFVPAGGQSATAAAFIAGGRGAVLPEQGKTAGQIAGEAAGHVGAGIEAGFKGLDALFGRKGTLGSGPAFDEETWAKAKPHFQAAFAEFSEAGKSLREFYRHILDTYNESIIPYLKRWHQELSDEHAGTGSEGKGPLDEVAAGEGVGTEGLGGSGPSDTRGGRGSAERDRGPDAAGVQVPRGGRSGVEEPHPAGAGAGGRPGAVGKGRTGRKRGGVPQESAGVTPAAPNIPGANFRITDEVRLGQGGEAEKFRDNLVAIRVLKNIEADNRRATPDEQRQLARYVGWGGLANAFADDQGAFKEAWKDRGKDLADLLTPQELRAARRSTRNAHFTSEAVTNAMWDGVMRLGYKGGLMLESSMGSGNFVGLMPDAVLGSTKVVGVEYDNLTSRIAQMLYPQATVLHAGFQKIPLADGEFALNIGNPPFGSESLRFQYKPEINRLSIHNQFFLAGQDALQPGGIQAMVVSRYLMDAQDTTTREEMATKVKLLGAIRLPDTAFKENARTEVVTDMLFFQRLTPSEQTAMRDAVDARRERPRKNREAERLRQSAADQVPSWTETTKVSDPLGGEDMVVNRYFDNHPEMIMGVLERSGTMRTHEEINVRLDKAENLADRLAKAIAQLPEDVVEQEPDAIAKAIERFATMSDALRIAVAGHEHGAIVMEHGKLSQIIERETPGGEYELTKRELGPDSPWSQQLMLDRDGKWYRLEVQTDEAGKPIKQERDGKKTKFNAYVRTTYENEAEIPGILRLGAERFEKLKTVIGLRDLLKQQIILETSDASKLEMDANRKKLAAAYTAFVKDYGLINLQQNASLVAEMPDGALVLALELFYRPELTAARAKRMGEAPRPASATPAPIMKERVLMPYAPPGKADSPSDALAITLSEFGRVDMKRVAGLLGMSEDEAIDALHTKLDTPLIFRDPETDTWETSNAYLSGQVKRKLNAAKAAGMQKNVEALDKVQPEAWGADKVTAILGGSWIPEGVYQDFVKHLTGDDAVVRFAPLTNAFQVSGNNDTQKAKEWSSPMAQFTWLLSRILNSQSIRITSRDSDGNTVFHEEETALAQLKAKEIENAFSDWVFVDSDRRAHLVEIFNDKFNTRVQRQHDGQHLKLPGKVPDAIISMRRHQKNAIWRGISERFMLLDHVVGAGKTFTAIARAMERRRMGLSRKPMIVVPNHLVEQFTADAYRLYPGAKVLAAGKADFEKQRRRRLFAKIATGDWDMVIVPHSSFGFIDIAPETEERFLDEELRIANQAIEDAWEAAKEDGTDNGRFKPFNVKEAEQLSEKIQSRIDALKDRKRDRLLTFEQLGVDDLTVDEAHEFKNLFYSSRLTGVRGMNDKVGSQKAFDLYTKIRVLRESPTGSVNFMTGTPISNSAVEMYQMMRYLAAEDMRDLGLEHFDAWRAQFVDISSKWEPTESGRLKEVNRLGRSWSNMRSLMDLYYSFTDSVSQEDINNWYAEDNNGAEFPIPKVKDGSRQSVVVKPTPAQLEQLTGILEGFDDLKNIQDIYVRNATRLRLMDRARKVSLDARAVDPHSPSKENGGKLETVAGRAAAIYKQWTPDKGTQIVFLDRGVRAAKADATTVKAYDAAVAAREKALREGNEAAYQVAIELLDKFDANEIAELRIALQGGWNAYDQLKQNMIASGIPANKVRFIQEANTDMQKQAIFDAVNAGEVRVLIGSTPKMGVGTNVQKRLVALHHVDVTWKPSDIEQREGRILRQGNMLLDKYGKDFAVDILAYVTERTVDAKMWDLNSTKLRTINGIRKYSGEFTMDFEDEDAVGMAEIAALASGDPLLLERVKVTSEIDKLELMERAYRRKMFGVQDGIQEAERVIRDYPAQIEEKKAAAKVIHEHLNQIEERAKKRRVTVEGKEFSSQFDAQRAVNAAVEAQQAGDEKAKYAITIDGHVMTNKADIEEAIADALGDHSTFEAEIDGKETGRILVVSRALMQHANEMLDQVTKNDRVSAGVGTILGFKASMQVRDAGKNGRVIDLTLTNPAGKTVSNDTTWLTAGAKSVSGQTIRAQVNDLVTSTMRQRVADTNWMQDKIRKAKEDLPRLESHVNDKFDKGAELEAKRARLQELIGLLAETQGGGHATVSTDESAPEAQPKLSLSPAPARSIPAPFVQRIVDRMSSKWANGPTIKVIATMDQAPARVRDYEALKRSLGAKGVIRGFVERGSVYVVAGNNGSVKETIETIFHESVGHWGLNGKFGARLDSILDEVAKSRADEIAAKAAHYKFDLKDQKQVRAAAEEILAVMASTNPKLPIVRRAIAAIRQFLRDIGVDLKLNDDDIIANFILPARAFVERGAQGPVTSPTAFSRSQNLTQTPEFSRNVTGALIPAEATPGPIERMKQAIPQLARNRMGEIADYLIYNYQDKFMDLPRIQKRLHEGVLPERLDVNLAVETYPKSVAAKVQDFHDDFVKPFVKMLHDSKLSIEKAQEYVNAKDAPDRNREMKARNPTAPELAAIKSDLAAQRDSLAGEQAVKDFVSKRRELRQTEADVEDGIADQSAVEVLNGEITALRKNQSVKDYAAAIDMLKALQPIKPFQGDNTALSGMSNAKAAEIIAKTKQDGTFEALEKVSTAVDTITARTRAVLLDNGLAKPDEIAAWEAAYPHYVPRFLDEVVDGTPQPVGQGFQVRGKESKRATGLEKEVTNILAHVMAAHEAAIIRAEKVKADRTMYTFLQAHPGNDVAELDVPPKVRDVDSKTGLVVSRVDPLYKNKPNVLVLKIDGDEHTITFNEDNPEALRLAASMKNLSAQDIGEITAMVGKFTRFVAMMSTAANPVFMPRNFMRDVGTAFVNLSDTKLADTKKQVFADIPRAIRGFWNMTRGKMDSEWSKLAREFRDAGGQTGFVQHYKDIGERATTLEKQLSHMGPGKMNFTKQMALSYWHLIEDANLAVENGVRLSAYVNARKAGLSQAKAISLSNNLTVNFNKGGARSSELNMWYMFMNASIQGTTRLVKAMGNRNVQKILGYVIASAFLLDVLNRGLAGDDDDDGENDYDQLPDYTKANNFVFYFGRPITIPMPYGYNFFASIGRMMGEAMFRKNYNAAKSAVNLGNVFLDAFSPMGQNGSLLQFAAPTIADPFVQWAENKNFAGNPLRKDQLPFGVPKPEYQMGFKSTSAPAKAIAEFMNDASGGNEVRPGLINMNPAAFDFAVTSLLGGAGRTYLQMFSLPVKAALGDEIQAREVPVVNIFASAKPEYQIERNFIEHLRAVQTVQEELKHYRGDPKQIELIREQHPGELLLIGQAKMLQNALEHIRKQERLIEKDKAEGWRDREKALEDRKRVFMAGFNRRYIEVTTGQ